MNDCAAIILAAGASSRLGQPKQLIQIAGESLLKRTVRLASEAGCSPVYVVLGKDVPTLADGVGTARIVINQDWQTGMASSVKSGLASVLAANPDQQNIMILVCDQPRLDLPILQQLIKTQQERRPAITASHYRGALGVPAVFSRAIFPQLLALTGDQGARKILQRFRDQVAVVDFPGGEFDLDTPEDLAKLNL